MTKVALITSLDYELFGDGSGNVSREQIKPTQKLVDIMDLYGVKLTVMFEYGQYLVYEKYAAENNKLCQDNQNICNQLISLVKNGHDVQLHYHAQWENARYDKEQDKFYVNLQTVDISTLKYERIVRILKEGKQFLENLLRPYSSKYICNGFRAGSWAVKDQEKLLRALREVGFKSDSSVVPNVKFESEQINFEYKDCPHQYHYWFVDEFLSKKGTKNNFVEIPIYTKKHPLGFLKYGNSKYFGSRNIVSKIYKTKISEKNFSFIRKIEKILFRNYYMADLNTMSAKTLINMVEDVLNTHETLKNEIIPIMFICHSKTSYKLDDLHVFYQYLEQYYEDKIEYWTYQKAISYLIDNNLREDK